MSGVRIHRSSSHLVLLDLGIINNPKLSYGAIGLYAYLASLDDDAFRAYVADNASSALLQELLAEGIYQVAE